MRRRALAWLAGGILAAAWITVRHFTHLPFWETFGPALGIGVLAGLVLPS